MTVSTAQRCKAMKRDGSPCGGFAGASGYCLAHDPQRAGMIAAARRAGGHARHGRAVGPVGAGETVALASMGDVLDLLRRAANDAIGLENSLNRARVLAYVAATWARCYETSELERRVAALEAGAHDGKP